MWNAALAPFWPTKPGDDDYGDNEVRGQLAARRGAATIPKNA